MIFADRTEAGRLLSDRLLKYRNKLNAFVLAIPRGGVVVGVELAHKLDIPLDVVVTKKIGAPENQELAIGAIAEEGAAIYDEKLLKRLRIDKVYLGKAERQVHKKIAEQIRKFRSGKELEVEGRTVILTDDGIATGYTIEAALHWLRGKKTGKVVLAVPTAAPDSLGRLKNLADEVVCLDKPLWFSAVGQSYKMFDQVSDEEVCKLLKK